MNIKNFGFQGISSSWWAHPIKLIWSFGDDGENLLVVEELDMVDARTVGAGDAFTAALADRLRALRRQPGNLPGENFNVELRLRRNRAVGDVTALENQVIAHPAASGVGERGTDGLLVAVTETTTEEDIESLASALEEVLA